MEEAPQHQGSERSPIRSEGSVLRVCTDGRWNDYLLNEGETVIGRRKATCQLAFPCSELSREHCSILIDKGEHFIMDLGSSNKTYRNSHCLRPKVFYELTDGCMLTLADMQCKYYKEGPPVSLDPVPPSVAMKSSGSSSNDHSDDTLDYEVDLEGFATVSAEENVSCQKMENMDAEEVVLETQDVDGGSTTCSEKSPVPDTINTPAGTGITKKRVVFLSLGDGSSVSAGKDTLGLVEPVITSSLEGDTCGSTWSPPLLQQQDVAKPPSPTVPYHDPPSPTVPYHDPPSPTVPYHDPPSPTAPYHDPPSPTAPYHDTPSPTAPYHDPPSPTIAYHDSTVPHHDPAGPTTLCHNQPSPTVPCHDLPSPTLPCHGPPTPTVPYQQLPSPTAPYNDSPTNSDNLDTRESNKDKQDELPGQNHPPTSTIHSDKEGSSPNRNQDKVENHFVGDPTEGVFGEANPSVLVDTRECRRDQRKEDDNELDIPATTTSPSSSTKGAQAPSVSSTHSQRDSLVTKSRKRARKVVTRAKKPGPKSKKIGTSSTTDDASADMFSDESPDLQSLSVSMPVTSVGPSEAVQPPVVIETPAVVKPSMPKKKIVLRKVEVTCSKSTSSKTVSPSFGKDIDIKTQKEHPAVSDAPVASSSPAPLPQLSPCVMFTGVIDETGSKTVCELGGSLAESVFDCTHLITDKVRRTVKFLCCMARGSLIVSPSWLKNCRVKKRFIPAEPFLVHDKTAEKQYGFKLSDSLSMAKKSPLLAGWKVYTTGHVKPTCSDMKEIISCAGGEVLESLPVVKSDRVVVIGCEEDSSYCEAAWDAGIPVCSAELILSGILRQQIDIEQHLLTPTVSLVADTKVTSGRKRKATANVDGRPAAKRKH